MSFQFLGHNCFLFENDKDLIITPTVNYGGGVDASQHFEANYDQLTSGGNFSFDFSADTNVENENNESWMRDASIVIGLNENIFDLDAGSFEDF